ALYTSRPDHTVGRHTRAAGRGAHHMAHDAAPAVPPALVHLHPLAESQAREVLPRLLREGLAALGCVDPLQAHLVGSLAVVQEGEGVAVADAHDLAAEDLRPRGAGRQPGRGEDDRHANAHAPFIAPAW